MQVREQSRRVVVRSLTHAPGAQLAGQVVRALAARAAARCDRDEQPPGRQPASHGGDREPDVLALGSRQVQEGRAAYGLEVPLDRPAAFMWLEVDCEGDAQLGRHAVGLVQRAPPVVLPLK